MNSASTSLRLLIAASVSFLAMAGCGGGGASRGTTTGVLTYFANFGSGNSGKSEVVTLTTAVGSQVAQQQVNAPTGSSTSPQQLVFSNLPSGTIYVHATLYSGSNGSGSAVGTAQAAVDGGNASTVTTDLGQAATSVVVAPSVAAVAVGQSVPLAAEALDASGNEVFENSVPNWSVSTGNGSIATVDQNGNVTGVAAGQAVVQATYGSLAPGSATVNVTSVTHGKWTIMVFLNASNSLDYYSYGSPSIGFIGNVPQMEKIAQTPTSDTRIVLQWKLSQNGSDSDPSNHPFDGTRRYLVTHNANASYQHPLDGLEELQDLHDTVDMGSPTALSQFVQWAEKAYPADHYALVMWDHGNGWERAIVHPRPVRAISEDDETGNRIEVWQLAQALANTNLDIISFDACLMQMLEVQNEVSGIAHYMVCSEDNTPAPGYPYDTAFSQFFSSQNSSTTSLAQGICDASISYYSGYGGPVSQSVIDLTKTSSLVTALNGFSQALNGAPSSISSTVDSIRSNSRAYDAADAYYYYDIGKVAQRFINANYSSSVTTAAQALLAADQAAIVYSKQNGLSPDSTGISFEFGNQLEFDAVANDYTNLKIASQTSWPTFLSSNSNQ